MSKVNYTNTRTWCEICSNLTIKTSERRHWLCSRVIIFNFEHILHLFAGVSKVDFEQVFVCCVGVEADIYGVK